MILIKPLVDVGDATLHDTDCPVAFALHGSLVEAWSRLQDALLAHRQG